MIDDGELRKIIDKFQNGTLKERIEGAIAGIFEKTELEYQINLILESAKKEFPLRENLHIPNFVDISENDKQALLSNQRLEWFKKWFGEQK